MDLLLFKKLGNAASQRGLALRFGTFRLPTKGANPGRRTLPAWRGVARSWWCSSGTSFGGNQRRGSGGGGDVGVCFGSCILRGLPEPTRTLSASAEQARLTLG